MQVLDVNPVVTTGEPPCPTTGQLPQELTDGRVLGSLPVKDADPVFGRVHGHDRIRDTHLVSFFLWLLRATASIQHIP